MKRVLKLCTLACGLILTMQVQAGVYMGTEASIPAKGQSNGDCDQGWNCPQPNPNVGQGYEDQTFQVYVREGSLKGNLERIIKMGRWKKLVWQLPYDYKWTGNVRMQADSLEDMVARLVTHYPLQATFYKTNRVVVITPRKKYHV